MMGKKQKHSLKEKAIPRKKWKHGKRKDKYGEKWQINSGVKYTAREVMINQGRVWRKNKMCCELKAEPKEKTSAKDIKAIKF